MSKKIIAKNGRAIFSPADQTIYTVETSSGEIPEGYIKPTGTLDITTNGNHSVETYANVEINVPIPSDYIIPTGTLTIDSNGTHNVREYESVEVNVESSGGSSGEDLLTAMENGTLTSYSNSDLRTLRSGQFQSCLSLESVDLPNCTQISKEAFYGCTKLKNVNIPNVTSISDAAFRDCSALTTVNIPNVTSISDAAFRDCDKLKSIDLPNVKSISNNTFHSCDGLTDIYLGVNQLVTLGGVNAFKYVKAGLKVHVRSEYADQYATATNWSSLIADGTIVIVGDYEEVVS